MRLRGKILIPLGLALAILLGVQVWSGITIRAAMLPSDRGLLLGLVVVQAVVTTALTIGLIRLIGSVVITPMESLRDLATGLVSAKSPPDLPADEVQAALQALQAAKVDLDAERATAREQYHALTKAQRAAAAANETKQAFLSNITHEVRTPLNGLLGSLDLLSSTPLTDEQQELALAARDSAHRLSGLIEQVLDLTEASDGSLHLSPEELDLRETFGLIVDVARKTALDHHVTYAFAPGGPLSAIADAARLTQVLAELLKNAVRATESGEVSVAVTTVHEGQRIKVRVEVEDDGPGIPDSLRAAIFEPFTQVDTTYTRAHDGPGLGLALCKRLLERMGGELGVDRRPGGGSRFWFVVRLADPDATSATCADALVSDTGHEPARVLLLEPDPAAGSRLLALLAEHGEVAHVDASEASVTTALAAQPYELALVRVDDPRADPELIQRLRAAVDRADQLTALVAVSAASAEARLMLVEQGWDDAVPAPLTRRAIAGIIATWLVSRSERLAG